KNRNDRSEDVLDDNQDFPVYIRRGCVSDDPDFIALSHWHDDVEFIHVQSGHMEYNINGKIVMINEGEGIFVNTRQLHYGFSEDCSECSFICVLLHPLLWNAVPVF